MIILSLCDRSGIMVKPWADKGYECWIIDTELEDSWDGKIRKFGIDVFDLNVTEEVYAAFAFPPCTHFALCGAKYWEGKPHWMLLEGLELVKECWRIIKDAEIYMLENPVGRLSQLWKPFNYSFHPYEYAGYCNNPRAEAYTKRTCLWTSDTFIMPERRTIAPFDGAKTNNMASTKSGCMDRNLTPVGFAKAVCEANFVENIDDFL